MINKTICTKCNKRTALKGFKQCKVCRDKQRTYRASKEGQISVWRGNHNEKGKARRKKYEASPKGRATAKKYRKSEKGKVAGAKYRMRHSEKVKARMDLYNAVTAGKVKKPLHCSSCGQRCECDGHHTDYNKPFDIIWLCRKCHNTLHNQSGVSGLVDEIFEAVSELEDFNLNDKQYKQLQKAYERILRLDELVD